MGNILDYLHWRGDLSFEQDEFNILDNLIFSEMAYIDYANVVPTFPHVRKILFKNAVSRVFENHGTKDKIVLGLILPRMIIELTDKAHQSKRFGEVHVSNYASILDKTTKTQFSAITYHINDELIYISYRGTDDSLIGWQENIDMLYTAPVVSQVKAVEYLEKVAELYPNAKIYLGGHSKGGNLANYACIYAKDEIKERIIECYSNDGQGFDKNFLDEEKFLTVKDKIVHIIPELDVVGMMFDTFVGKTIICKSNANGIYQHDGFSWQIDVKKFKEAKELSPKALKLDRQLTKMIKEVPLEDKVTLGNNLYDFIQASQLDTLLDCKKESIRLLKYLNKFSGKSKQLFLQVFGDFLFL